MISTEAIRKILDIKGNILLTPSEMAKKLRVTFINADALSSEIKFFKDKLEGSLLELGVEIVPLDQAFDDNNFSDIWRRIVLYIKIYLKIIFSILINGKKSNLDFLANNFIEFNFKRKFKKNISIFVFGEIPPGRFPINRILNLRDNPIITVLDDLNDVPINKDDFKTNMDKALNIFSKYMTNIAVVVNNFTWTIYSFNLSHPAYLFDENFKLNILNSLITKISAPVIPPRLKEFVVRKDAFDVMDISYSRFIADMVEGAKLFKRTDLFPEGKKVDELSFKNYFYRYIGQIHLDQRNGMSYGFIARQLPVKLSQVYDFNEEFASKFGTKDYYTDETDKIFIKLNVEKKIFVLQVPDIWVLTTRSGCDKTNIDPSKDIIKLGLVNGEMILELPKGKSLDSNYRPSFDTKIILAHAVGNAIFCSILKKFNKNIFHYKHLETSGLAIVHWHGYINPEDVPNDWLIYGGHNPSVSCSAPQTAIYALQQKEQNYEESVRQNRDYIGEIHIEPQHGINVIYEDIVSLAGIVLSNNNFTALGNKFFK